MPHIRKKSQLLNSFPMFSLQSGPRNSKRNPWLRSHTMQCQCQGWDRQCEELSTAAEKVCSSQCLCVGPWAGESFTVDTQARRRLEEESTDFGCWEHGGTMPGVLSLLFVRIFHSCILDQSAGRRYSECYKQNKQNTEAC